MNGDAEWTADALREYLRTYPRYATLGGAWSGPTGLVELDAAQELARELEADGLRRVSDVAKRSERMLRSPPDCLARSECGGLIGIEVTELADGNLVRENVKRQRSWVEHVRSRCEAVPGHQARLEAMAEHPQLYLDWGAPRLVRELQRIISRKSRATFESDGEPYAERWLLIITDEPALDIADFRDVSERREFESVVFDSVFLMGSLCPGGQRHPYVRLGLPS